MTKTYPARRNVSLIRSVVAAILVTIGYQHFAAAQMSAQSTPQSNEISADVKSLLEFYEKKIYFTENKGQWASNAIFRADFPLGQAVATTEGMMVGTYDPAGMAKRHEQGIRQEQAQHDGLPFNEEWVNVKGHGWMLNFVGHSPSMSIESKSKHKDVFNYLSGDAAASKTGVANYQEIWYKNVYDNVDVRYYPSATGSLEYDMICKPGFNKDNIVLQFDGISKVTKKSDGSLVLQTSVGEMILPAPVAYQKINGEKKSVKSQYVVTGSNSIKFEVGAFDAAHTLIIDPIALRWATWINSGSTGDNHGHCIWVDGSDGAIYVVARVQGTTDNITVGAMNTTSAGALETIIGKYYQPTNIGDAGTRSWQTYIGGSADDNPYAMEQGPDGNLYITGQTGSTNFPLIKGTAFTGSSLNNASQTGDDIFVMKITQDGASMKAAVVGGNGTDNSYDLRITSSGDIVVCGNSTSTNLLTLYPGSGAVNSSSGTDVFVFKINQDLSAISWMRNYGGTGTDQAMIMQMNNANGDIYLGGSTTSNNFPVSNAREGSRSGSTRNGFIQKLKSTGATVWSTYYNASSTAATSILCMEFNTLKNKLYFGGITTGLNANNLSAAVSGHAFPDVTYNSGTNDFFAASIDTAHTVVAGTYIGGSLNEVNMMGLNVDLNNDVYIFGYTNSTNFPVTPNAFQSTNRGSNDKVFLKLSSTFDSLLASTYYGGADDDYDPVGERGIKFSDCRIYTIVTARSLDVPLTQGAVTTTRSSANTVYEPGLVVWANPPDLSNNTLTGNQEVCPGGSPVGITGSAPSYILPTITRNGTTSSYPSLGVSITYQWQSSTDSVNWTNIAGATGQNLSSAQAGILFTKTFYRRVIGGDACVIEGSSDQIIVVKVIKITGTVTNATCNGAATGSIAAVATNGTAPYSYSWSNGATTATASNLVAGDYTLTVTDASGCSNTATYTVTQPNALSVSTTPGGAGYCITSGGSANASASGGVSPYTYLWSNSATTSSISGLVAGTYSVTVTDSKGCTSSSSITLGAPVVSCSRADGLCEGDAIGSATVTATGGAAPYSYLWSNGGTTSTISGLAPGNYSVTVTGANGCTASCNVTISGSLSAIVSTVNATCNGLCDGRASVAVTGGLAPYTYLWSNGATTSSITSLCANGYSVTVTDSRGCTVVSAGTVSNNISPQISLSSTNVYCEDDHSGTITVNHLSGQPPYTYLWSNGATTQTITGLGLGTYSVTVTDARGCSTSSSTSIQVYSNLVALVNTTQATNGNNGTASLSIVGGVAPYTYLWSNGQTTSSLSGLSVGSYSVTVTDAAGNFTVEPFSITDANFIASGAFIINMGITPQTIANGLKPYGLIYDLVRNYNVPVKWIINQSKVKDGIDFSHNGIDFRSGAFVVEPDYRTPAVNAVIASWQSQGVQGTTSVSDLSLPVYNTITSFSNVVIDQQNEQLVTPYFANAGIPSSIYYVGLPSDLDNCDDTYVMPHADPTWSTHSNLITFNTTHKGYIWGGCHAPSVLEGINGSSPSPGRMNFLTTSGLQCFGSNKCGSLINEAHGDDATTPYTYQSAYDSDPIMQFMGDETPSSENGSEQWYIPLTTGSWRSTTKTVITTADGSGTRKGVKLVYGPGYGNNNNGKVLYQAGHTADRKGTIASQVAFERAFFNFILDAGVQKRLNITSSIPQSVMSGTPTNLSVSVSGGSAPYTYAWSTSCGGTFSNETSASTTITFQNMSPQTKCFITCVVTDACGRRTFVSSAIGIENPPPPPYLITINDQINLTCFGTCTGSIDITVSGSTPPYTYLWSNGRTTEDVSNLCAGDYTLVVRDANNCSKTKTFTITQPSAPLSATCSKTDVPCFGGNTGSVSVVASGGTAPYTYSWTGGGTTTTVNGKAAGTYTVTVTDANGCTTTCSATVGQPAAALSAICNKTDALCFGGSTGSVSVTPSGGTAPYTYSWTGGGTTATVNGKAAGTYTVTVTDANNCTTTCSATVGQPAAALSATCNKTDALCFGSSTGAVSVTASGGTAPYTYSWTGGGTTATVNNRAAGTYTVTVTDAKGCTTTCSATVGQPPAALTVTCNKTDALCFGTATGSVSVTAQGGTLPYTYSWTGGGATATVNGKAAGTYTVTVTDANGCSNTCSATVGQPAAALSATCNKTDALCFGGSTGSVSVVASGGTAPYTYSWTGGGTTATVNGKSAGTYTVTVTDANGCTTTCSATVGQPAAALSATCSKTDVLCFGGSTGSVSVVASGGTAPYTYSWTGGGTTATVNGKAAGTYTVTVKDANNCTTTCSATVGQPAAALSATCNKTDALCFGGNTGSVSVTASGGTAPYTYSWTGGGTTATVNGKTAGTYTVTVTDANNCTTTCSATVGQPAAGLSGNVTATVATCTQSNSTATPHISGGTQPYTYLWSNGQTTATGTGYAAGNYSVVVTDANACTLTVTFTVAKTNCPPVAVDDYRTTQEDVPVTVTVVSNDTDVDGNIDPSTVTLLSSPANGTAVVNPDGTVTYTPFSHYVGPDQFNYQVCDDGTPLPIQCDQATVFITVVGTPTIIIDSIPEDSLITLCLDDYVNLQGGISSISVCGMPSNGTFTINGICATYTPTANWNGTDTMCVISCNASNVCDTTPIIIIVIPVNDPPVANDDFETTQEDVPVTVTVVTNDTDIDGNIDPATVVVVVPPSNGTAVVNPDGTVTYTPGSHYVGYDHFVYNVCDDGTPLPALCDTASVFITVTGVPTIIIDSIPEDSLITLCLEDYVTLQGGISSVSVCGMPQNGTFTISGTCATYTPTANWNGTDTMCVISCNASNVCDTTPIIIIVIPVNDPPVANDDFETTQEDVPVTVTVVTNDTDIDGNIDPATVVVVVPPSNGTAVVNPDGTVTYTPGSHYVGYDHFVYNVCDDGTPLPALCDTASVFITVIGVPTIIIDSIPEDSLITICLDDYVNLQGGISSISVCGMPQNGTFTLSGLCATYTPTANWNGTDTMCVISCNASNVCDTTPIIIIVIPVNDPPIAVDDYGVTQEDVPVTVTVVLNDIDIDGNIDPSTVVVVSPPSNGTVVVNPDGTITYTPGSHYVGSDHFVYNVCDDGTPLPALCDTASVFITVTGVPTIIIDSIPEDSLITLCLEDYVTLQGGISSVSVCGMPQNGTFTISGTCATYTPTANWNGTDTMCVISCNASNVCDTTPIIIIVIPVNDPPIAVDDSLTTNEDTPGTVVVVTNDTDIDGNIDPSTVVIITPPTHGTAVVNPDGSVTYTPDSHYYGPDSLVYQVCDDGTPLPALCDQATVHINVIPVNLPPLAIDDINNTLINTPVSGNVLTNDTDPDGDAITVTGVVTPPSNGTVTLNPDGSYTYIPNTGFTGEDHFSYAVCDNGVPGPLCDTATVYITVIPVTVDNNPPIANPDNAVTLINVPVGGNVLVNDGDPDGDNIILNTTPISNPSNGTVVLNPDGSYIYTPNTNFVGVDVFVYEICDDGVPSLCDQTTVTIHVLDDTDPDNDPPFAADDAYLTPENVAVSGNVLTNDFDPNGDPITINTTPVVGTVNGTVVINPDGSFTYTPNTDYIGPDQFVYEICDNGGLSGVVMCAQGTAYITVYPVNLPPVAIDDINNTLINTPVSGNVLTNDFDQDGDNIAVTVNTNPSNGSVVVNPDGSYTYTPNNNFTGEDTFTYTICDDGNPGPMCDVATVTIHVIPVTTDNNPPIANPDNAVTLVNVPVGGNVLVNDGDPDGDNIILNTTPISNPSNGTVVLNPDGSYIYTPNTDFVGVDVFVYEICDDGMPSLCDQTTVTITVLDDTDPDNDPPFAADDAYLTPENVAVSGNVLTNDFDPNGDPITINTTPVVGTVNGTVVINPDGSFTYTPNTDYIGPDQFVYEICDNGGLSGVVMCAQGTAYITVYPANLPPVAVDDINNTLVNTPVSGNVLTNDFDQDGDNIAVTSNTNPSNGSVVVNPDGSYTYTPNTGYTGEDTFTYTICDDGNPGPLCDVATVTIHIIEVTSDNNPPIANPDNAVTLINVPVGGNVLVNDGDPDGDNIILNTTPISDPSNGSVVLNPDGSYIYTPNTDFVGVDVFVYEICDDGVPSMCDQTTVTIKVLDNPNGPDNDPPFAADDAYLTPVNTPVSGNVLTNDFDPNGDPITINTTPVTGPQHGTVVINNDGTFTYTPDTGYIGPDQYVYSICDNGGLSGVVLCAQGTVYITVYPTMNITLDPTDASCYGYSDGSVELTVLNGVAPYTYVWSNGATTEDLTGVPAGVYTVTVSDAFGLVVSGTATVGEPAQVTVSIDPSGPTTFCQGGSVTLSATSAFTGTYLWSNGATTQSINVSVAGVYTVTLTDVNGCSGTSSSVEVFVNPNPTPVVTASGPTTFCNGGSVVLTSSPAATYVWAPGGELTQSITVTASGNYSVWVMDANGCEGISAPVFVTVNSNPAPIVSASGPTEFCAGGNVTLTATGSSNIASYLWAPNGETTAAIVVDSSGIYSVTVTDVNGCVGTSNPVTVTVNPNPTPVVDANGPTTFCAGGSVVLSSSPAASYVWSPNGETTQSITVTATGSYSVAVLDANGCSGVSAAVNVTVNPNPTPDVTPSGPTTFCEGGSVTLTSSAADMYVWAPNGETTQSITVTATGVYSVWVMDANGCEGTSANVPVTINSNPTPVVDADGPTTFCQGESVMLTSSSATGNIWSPTGEITQSIVVQSAGDYFVTVTDVNGCVGVSDTVTVVVNTNPTPTVTPDGPTTFCDGGSVTLTASAASGYIWTPNGETTQSITVSSSGTYSVTVFDVNGCRGNSGPIVVVENSNPIPVITPDGPTTFCEGGSVTLTASAAAGYLWSPNGETTQSITVTATGDYAVTVTDANGCSGASAPVHVQVSAPIVVTVTTSGPTEICQGQSVTLTAVAANAASYQWFQNGAAIAGATGASITVSDFADYHVVVTDQNGCTGNSPIVLVKVGEIPNAYAGLDQFVCPGGTVTLTATGGQNFLWSNGETTQSIVVSPSQATDYTVTVTNPFCGQSDVDTVNVDIATLPVAAIHASDNPSLGNPVNFTDVSGDNSITSWFWNFGDGTSAMTQNAHHTYDAEGNFTVVLTVENQYGCSDTDSVVVEVKQIILIPNIITPNGDGLNDAISVKNNGVDDYGLTIFNRWGQIVYERESREINWDGKTNSGVALEAGTYFYILVVKNTGSLGNFEQTGFITLIR